MLHIIGFVFPANPISHIRYAAAKVATNTQTILLPRQTISLEDWIKNHIMSIYVIIDIFVKLIYDLDLWYYL